jgi:hypothetical protein
LSTSEEKNGPPTSKGEQIIFPVKAMNSLLSHTKGLGSIAEIEDSSSQSPESKILPRIDMTITIPTFVVEIKPKEAPV